LRRLAVIKVAQRLGVSLETIRQAFQSLPDGRAPTAAEWRGLSRAWKNDLNDRIARLCDLRDRLSDCIGCGCLSLKICPLRNPLDKLSADGPGSRLLEHRRVTR
jgi:MerR family redox-sensitive transcriptional activator SoxR